MPSPIVYVVQEPLVRRNNGDRPEHKHSLEPARKFGELCVLTQWSDARPPVDHDALTDLMVHRLQNFTKDDYLLLAGNPGLIALASIVAAQYTDGYVKILIWDRIKQDYEAWPLNVKLLPDHSMDPSYFDRSAE